MAAPARRGPHRRPPAPRPAAAARASTSPHAGPQLPRHEPAAARRCRGVRGGARRRRDVPRPGTAGGLPDSRPAPASPGPALVSAHAGASVDRWAGRARHTGRAQQRLDGRVDARPEDREHRYSREAVGHLARLRAERHDGPRLVRSHRAVRDSRCGDDVGGERMGSGEPGPKGHGAGSGRVGTDIRGGDPRLRDSFPDDRQGSRAHAMTDRVPPGQIRTDKWPVLHYGNVPKVDTKTWTFELSGLVDRPYTLTYDELLQLPRKTITCDMHCVTTWSRLDNTFEGVAVQLLLERAGVKPAAGYALVYAEQGFTTNLPLADLNRSDNLIALKWGGEWLTPEHGWPARLLVPHLYLWKSAKWVRGIELLEQDIPGFWEQNGYHMRGDPWTEQRYGGRGLTQHEINKFRNASKKKG